LYTVYEQARSGPAFSLFEIIKSSVIWSKLIGGFMLGAYLPIVFLVVIAAVFGLASVTLSSLIGVKKPSPVKLAPYESGCEPVGTARERFSIKFYIIAMLFILFDIEAVFMYPWAVVFKSFVRAGNGAFMFGEMIVLIVLIFVDSISIWNKGA